MLLAELSSTDQDFGKRFRMGWFEYIGPATATCVPLRAALRTPFVAPVPTAPVEGDLFGRTSRSESEHESRDMEFPEAQVATQRILELTKKTSPIVIAVDGRSGTGKSTLSAWIALHVGATLIDQDDFYAGGDIDMWRHLTPREKAHRVIDWRRVRTEALLPLRSGVQAHWHPFDWEAMEGLASKPITAQPSRIVILDGAYSSRPELGDLIDLSILVTLPDAVRRERLQKREGEGFISEWFSIWDEAEEYYFGTVRPSDTFDLVIERPVEQQTGREPEPIQILEEEDPFR